MESTLLQKKIAGLPEHIKQQVADYVDFLVERYQNTETSLTDTEKQVLEERLSKYLNNASQTVELEEVKNRLLKKYGLSG